MDFDLSDEQRLLKDSVDRLVDDNYSDFAKRQTYAREPDGFSARLWAQYAELGLLGLPFGEDDGGSCGAAVETMIVMEAFGRGLVLEPYFASVILGGGFLRAGGHVIEGDKSVVLHGDSATHLVVSARTSGTRRDAGGLSLFLVDATAEGVSRRGYPTQDGLRGADVSFAQVRVGDDALIGAADNAAPLIGTVVDTALAALCAEAVGAMAALQALTVDYLKQRKQFGTPIGSFQVLQHRAVDMLIAVEQARSMAMYAAMMAGEPDANTRRSAVASAKVQVNRSSRQVGQEAIQLHGGIGMTMEYKAGHYFKRLAMIEQLFGDTEHHLRIVAGAM
jgi:alkylation response protein AidB-like acyl-CoA dehydrogenase